MFESVEQTYVRIVRTAQELIRRPVCYFLKDRALNTLVTYAAIKVIVLLGGLLVAMAATRYHILAAVPPFPELLTNWDGGWYTGIARNWYTEGYPNSAAFPPLYPLLIKVLSFNQPAVIPWVAVILSNAFSFVGLYFLYKLVPLIMEERYRLRVCFAYMIFPVLIVCTLVAYSEALFLALTIGAYYYWKRSRFAFAALLAVLSIFARQVGAFILIIFVVDMAWEYWSRRNTQRMLKQLRVIAVTCLSVGALYLFYYLTFGDPFIVARVEAANWQNTLSVAHVYFNIGLSLIGVDVQPLSNFTPFPVPLIAVSSALLAATAFCLLRRDAGLAAYSLVSVVLFLLMSTRQSFPRFVAATFPIYLFFGLMLSRDWKKNLLVGVIAVIVAIQNMTIWISGAWLY
ncbi:MAG: hypothetical protein ACXV49_05245 [Halobacteriota archaeon]